MLSFPREPIFTKKAMQKGTDAFPFINNEQQITKKVYYTYAKAAPAADYATSPLYADNKQNYYSALIFTAQAVTTMKIFLLCGKKNIQTMHCSKKTCHYDKHSG